MAPLCLSGSFLRSICCLQLTNYLDFVDCALTQASFSSFTKAGHNCMHPENDAIFHLAKECLFRALFFLIYLKGLYYLCTNIENTFLEMFCR